MFDSVRPHRRKPTRLRRPWDSPGKNTGVGCHFLLQCMKVKSESEVTQSCLALSDLMDCSLPGSSIHGIFQARVLEWGAIPTWHMLLLFAFLFPNRYLPSTTAYIISKSRYNSLMHMSFLTLSLKKFCTGRFRDSKEIILFLQK